MSCLVSSWIFSKLGYRCIIKGVAGEVKRGSEDVTFCLDISSNCQVSVLYRVGTGRAGRYRAGVKNVVSYCFLDFLKIE